MDASLAILKSAKQQSLYDSLIHQLNKDFVRAGIDSNFSTEDKHEALARNLVACIYEVIISDFEKYLNLLYAIDVSEARIKELPAQFVHELAEEVAILILEREFLKVSFKNKHE